MNNIKLLIDRVFQHKQTGDFLRVIEAKGDKWIVGHWEDSSYTEWVMVTELLNEENYEPIIEEKAIPEIITQEIY